MSDAYTPTEGARFLLERESDDGPAGSTAEGRCGSIDGGALRPAGSTAEGRCGSIDGGALRPAGSTAEGRCGSIDGGALRPAGSTAEGRCGSIDGRRAVYRAAIYTPDATYEGRATLADDATVTLAIDAPAELRDMLEMLGKLTARAAAKKRADGLPPWPARVLRWRGPGRGE